MAKIKCDMVTQCRLQAWDPIKYPVLSSEEVHMMGWIDTCFAHIGNLLVDEDGLMWKVTERYTTHPKAYIEAHERDYLKQRGGSDI